MRCFTLSQPANHQGACNSERHDLNGAQAGVDIFDAMDGPSLQGDGVSSVSADAMGSSAHASFRDTIMDVLKTEKVLRLRLCSTARGS